MSRVRAPVGACRFEATLACVNIFKLPMKHFLVISRKSLTASLETSVLPAVPGSLLAWVCLRDLAGHLRG